MSTMRFEWPLEEDNETWASLRRQIETWSLEEEERGMAEMKTSSSGEDNVASASLDARRE